MKNSDSFDPEAQVLGFVSNINNVLEWAFAKGLLETGNHMKQHGKLEEEVAELKEAMEWGNLEHIKLELGDCQVVLTILASHWGLSLPECLDAAYQKIKNRTGKTVNGEFIRDRSQ
jgi:hypothetical protein